MHQPSLAQGLVALIIAAGVGTAVFFHAERNRIRNPSLWASAVFLVLAIALPLYVLQVRRTRRARRGF